MSDKEDSDFQEKEDNPLKYAKKYVNPRGEMEPIDFNPLAEEHQRRIEDRVNRFGVLSTAQALNRQNLQALFESLAVKPPSDFESVDISEDTIDKENSFTKDSRWRNNEPKKSDIRYEAIHLHGVDEMSTDDIFTYFNDFPPKYVEWVNDSSCNVVYSGMLNACKVLLAKSTPYDGDDDVKTGQSKESNEKKESGEENGEAAMDTDESNHIKKGRTTEERWRLGDAYTKASKLLMRFATVRDQKKGGKPEESRFYQKYGNPNLKIWTKNLKHKKNKIKEEVDTRHRSNDSDDIILETNDNDNIKLERVDNDDIIVGGDDNDAPSVFEDRKNGSVKDRLGSRQDDQHSQRRRRSPSKTRSGSQDGKRKSVKKYSVKKSSKDELSGDGITSFDRHVKEELEARKMRSRRVPRELWTNRKRHYEHDDDRGGSDYDAGGTGGYGRHGGVAYKSRRVGYDDDDEEDFEGGVGSDNDDRGGDGYRRGRVNKGGVKSRLGEREGSKGGGGGFGRRGYRGDDRFGSSDVERRRGRDDDYRRGRDDDYRRGRDDDYRRGGRDDDYRRRGDDDDYRSRGDDYDYRSRGDDDDYRRRGDGDDYRRRGDGDDDRRNRRHDDDDYYGHDQRNDDIGGEYDDDDVDDVVDDLHDVVEDLHDIVDDVKVKVILPALKTVFDRLGRLL